MHNKPYVFAAILVISLLGMAKIASANDIECPTPESLSNMSDKEFRELKYKINDEVEMEMRFPIYVSRADFRGLKLSAARVIFWAKGPFLECVYSGPNPRAGQTYTGPGGRYGEKIEETLYVSGKIPIPRDK